MTKTRITLAAAVLIGVLLTGCTSTSDPAPSASAPAPVASTPSDATPTPDTTSPAAPAVPAVGATVTTPAEVDAAKGAGLGIYTASSGAQVVVDPHQPLPADVVADLRAISGLAETSLPDKEAGSARVDKIVQSITAAGDAGKTLVAVGASGVYGQSGKLEKSYYAIATLDRAIVAPGVMFSSASDALTAAQAAIAAQPDPSIYELVDLTK